MIGGRARGTETVAQVEAGPAMDDGSSYLPTAGVEVAMRLGEDGKLSGSCVPSLDPRPPRYISYIDDHDR
jgi:hypothetical protein